MTTMMPRTKEVIARDAEWDKTPKRADTIPPDWLLDEDVAKLEWGDFPPFRPRPDVRMVEGETRDQFKVRLATAYQQMWDRKFRAELHEYSDVHCSNGSSDA